MFSLFRKECRKLIPEEYAPFLEIPRGSEADLALPCFAMAKEQKKPPHEIARALAGKIKIPKGSLVRKAEASGPYVNFFINYDAFLPLVLRAAAKKDYGRGSRKKGRVMVEFSQPNTHKGFHVGHLRNTCLGDSLVRTMRFAGYSVIAANYIGDIGAHVAKALWAYGKFHRGKEPPVGKGRWLGDVYAEAVRKLEENEEYEKEYLEVLRKLYGREKETVRLWKRTRKMSLDEFDAIYRELGVRFDVVFCESGAEDAGKKFVKAALANGIAKQSDGAIIFDLRDFGLDVLVVLRSDGTPLYSTKDLGLAEMKFRKFRIDKSVYVVGAEQAFYFRQLFKALELLGFKQALQCHHLPYELVMLKEGKMSSREGNVVLYEDLMKGAAEKAENEIRKRDIVGKALVKRAAEKIALAALKYSMLNRENNKVIVFDWDAALSFEGDTGPYLLYTFARCRSILRKSRKKPKAGKLGEEEQEIIKQLSLFPEIARSAAEEYSPHKMAAYAFRLASLFNEYYHATRVIGSEKERERLALAAAVANVLKTALELLGIEAPERM